MNGKMYSVTEICGDKVKLADDGGKMFYLERSLLPAALSEGDILRFDAEGEAKKDSRSTDDRRRRIKDKHKKLIKNSSKRR